MICYVGQKCPGKLDKDRKRNTPLMDARSADAKFQELAQSQGWTQCPNCGYVVCKTVWHLLISSYLTHRCFLYT